MQFMRNCQVTYAGAEKEMLKESQVYTGIADKAAPNHTWLSQVWNHATSSRNLGSKQKCTFTYELHHKRTTWRLFRLLGLVSTLDLIGMHDADKVRGISARWLPHNEQLQRTGSALSVLKGSSHSDSWKSTIQLCTTHRLQNLTSISKSPISYKPFKKKKKRKNGQEQNLQLQIMHILVTITLEITKATLSKTTN